MNYCKGLVRYVPVVYECKKIRLKRPNLSKIKTLEFKSSQKRDFSEIKGVISPKIGTCKGLRAKIVTMLVEIRRRGEESRWILESVARRV